MENSYFMNKIRFVSAVLNVIYHLMQNNLWKEHRKQMAQPQTRRITVERKIRASNKNCALLFGEKL